MRSRLGCGWRDCFAPFVAAFASARPCCSGLRASLICCPAWQLVVVAVCQLLNKDYYYYYYYYSDLDARCQWVWTAKLHIVMTQPWKHALVNSQWERRQDRCQWNYNSNLWIAIVWHRTFHTTTLTFKHSILLLSDFLLFFKYFSQYSSVVMYFLIFPKK